MYCEKCGNELKAGQEYCPKCGTKIGSGKFRKQTIIYAVIIGILVAVIAFLILSFALPKKSRRNKPRKHTIETVETIESAEDNKEMTTGITATTIPTTTAVSQTKVYTIIPTEAETIAQPQNYTTNAPVSSAVQETISSYEAAAIKAAEAAALAVQNEASAVGPGGAAQTTSKNTSTNIEQNGPSATYKTIKGVKENDDYDDDDEDYDEDDDEDDDDDDEDSSSTKNKTLRISSKETIEDSYEDDDENVCEIIYVKPIMSGSTSEENDAINSAIDDMMEEIMDSIYTTVESYSTAPKSVKFSTPTISSQTSQLIKITLKATISLRSSGTRTITYVITYNRSDEEATLSKS